MTSADVEHELQRALQEARQALPSYIRFLRENQRPKELWHYTSGEGLYGILCEDSFHATDVYYFNDASEVAYALRLIAEVLPQLKKGRPVHSQQIVDLIANRFSRFADGRDELPQRMYAVCFCEGDDLLSQWRAYGARGGGYSLGFSMEEFLKGISYTALGVYPVLYNETEQRDLVRDTLYAACEAFTRVLEALSIPSGRIRALVPLVAQDVTGILLQYLVAFKTSLFSEEKEWRIVSFDDPADKTVEFRVLQGIIVPYRQVRLGNNEGERLPLSCVRKGPTLEPQLAKRALRDVLRFHGYGHAEIRASDIPLRA